MIFFLIYETNFTITVKTQHEILTCLTFKENSRTIYERIIYCGCEAKRKCIVHLITQMECIMNVKRIEFIPWKKTKIL